ncbi:transcriptional regulator [Aequoribacter fuscus]|jgi:DNA-binding HxlR family transcriptional regulator|uniref:winged helix-turn-helix transcriptional regulator n=1 Tax=Aequoribacter fuscus TaxID=2518989 RepID=UPI0002E0E0FB|nr:helix-turn-helix domain-containing protein [Aequoribacter fuscus]QHJ86995.1 transcriptional regulator [Aequoribacter fuscus]
MKQTPLGEMRCSAARALNEVGPWWSLLLVRCCLQGLSRFNEFQVALGIGKNTLSIRLKELIHDGVLTKVHASDGSKFHEYQLTEKGVELAPVILALSTWGDKWLPHELGPSVRLHDNRSGKTVGVGFVDDEGEAVSPEFIQWTPGEGVIASLSQGGR